MKCKWSTENAGVSGHIILSGVNIKRKLKEGANDEEPVVFISSVSQDNQ